jgi:hypothetical protein
MSITSNTKFKNNELASDYHRILGKCLYYLDSDQTELEERSAEATMKEFTYENGHPRTVALIDFKYPGNSLSDKYASIQYQIYNSEQEYKVPVPFFMTLYYLDLDHDVKMYYVIPANVPARKYFDKCELPAIGAWMSVKKFSKFLHAIRGKTWNGEESINDTNLFKVNLPAGTKLKNLSSKIKEYKLPYFDFSWISNEKR